MQVGLFLHQWDSFWFLPRFKLNQDDGLKMMEPPSLGGCAALFNGVSKAESCGRVLHWVVILELYSFKRKRDFLRLWWWCF